MQKDGLCKGERHDGDGGTVEASDLGPGGVTEAERQPGHGAAQDHRLKQKRDRAAPEVSCCEMGQRAPHRYDADGRQPLDEGRAGAQRDAERIEARTLECGLENAALQADEGEDDEDEQRRP